LRCTDTRHDEEPQPFAVHIRARVRDEPFCVEQFVTSQRTLR
jgi:hypothetical protein